MNIQKVNATLYRGSQPKEAGDFGYLRDIGVKYILDLQSGAGWFKDGSPLEENLMAANYGIQVFNHPLGAIFPPTKKELTDGLQIIGKYQPIFVHCKDGVDRTGMMIAYFRMNREGWSKERAVKEMRGAGMHPWYFYWAWAL